MRIGFIDVDNNENLNDCFPNLPLMKLSAYHKSKGDEVGWYDPLDGWFDKVYMSKVFSFTKDYEYPIYASEIEKGGSGYCISLIDGKEVFDKSKDKQLPYEIEHIYPDYSLYGITDTAYGFMSRGCPRGCDFCHVKDKEGLSSKKCADLKEFWNGQKNIELLDPNTLACKDWENILSQLQESKAYVDFNQGVDIRLMTKGKAKELSKVKVKHIHFAYDRYQDKNFIEKKFIQFKDESGWNRDKVSVYVLCNFDTTMDQNMDRIMFLRNLDFNPYVMLYDKDHIRRGDDLRKLQRWCNNKVLFWKYKNFEEFKRNEYK